MTKVKRLWENGRRWLDQPQSNIFSAALVIAFTYGISMILGILRERLIVARFYAIAPQDLDVYFAAFRLPDMVFQMVVIGALSAAFIPVFADLISKDQKQADRLAASVLNLLLGVFLVLALVIFVWAEPFSRLITGKFTESQIQLMVQMTRVMLLAQVFFLVSNFFSAINQSHRRFLLPALSPVVYNLGIIIAVWFLSSWLGIWSATVGVLVGAFLHLLIQLPLVMKLGFHYSLSLDFRHPGVKKVLRLMLPRTLALAAGQVEATVSLFLATSLATGSLTLFYLAQRLSDLPVRLLGTSVGQAALPILSAQLAQGRREVFEKTLNRTLAQIIFLALPATGFFLVLRLQFVRLAYGASTFPWEATIATGRTLAAITLSIFSQSAIQLLVRAFYALYDTLTPFLISLFSVALNIALSLFFLWVWQMGIFGLALAFSLSNLVNLILLLVFFNFRHGRFLGLGRLSSWIKMGVSTLLGSFSAWLSMRLLDLFVFETSYVLPLVALTLISLAVGSGVYLMSAYWLRLEELSFIFSFWRKLRSLKQVLGGITEIVESS